MPIIRDLTDAEKFPPKGFTEDNLVKRIQVDISSDDLRDLTSGITLIEGVTGKFIQLVANPAYKYYYGTVAFTNSYDMVIETEGGETQAGMEGEGLAVSTSNIVGFGILVNSNSLSAEGEGIELTAATDWVGATADGTLVIELLYREIGM